MITETDINNELIKAITDKDLAGITKALTRKKAYPLYALGLKLAESEQLALEWGKRRMWCHCEVKTAKHAAESCRSSEDFPKLNHRYITANSRVDICENFAAVAVLHPAQIREIITNTVERGQVINTELNRSVAEGATWWSCVVNEETAAGRKIKLPE